MNAATETVATPVAAAAATRPFYWSVRRELWEHRALFIAPLAAAGVIILGVILNAMHLPDGMKALGAMSPERQHSAVYNFLVGIAIAIWMTLAVVAWFYSLDALHGERKDRSILFWKSMPVSDTTTVLTKFFVVMAVAPAIAFVVTVVTQLLVLMLSTIVVLIAGASPAPMWTNLQFFQQLVVLLYALAVASLWYAPICAWLLLISAWAKRSTFLWAVLPPIALLVLERMALGTKHVSQLIGYRLQEGLASAFNVPHGKGGVIVNNDSVDAGVRMTRNLPDHLLQLLNPAGLLSNVHLWAGLVVAAALLAAAMWMRRYREPI